MRSAGVVWVVLLGCMLVTLTTGHGEDEQSKKEADPDYVLVLTKDNFEEAIAQNKYILVEFYSPGCKHCHILAPVYSSAAKLLNDQDSEIKMAKVDATQERDLAQQYNIGGYPTVLFFRSGTPIDYKIIQDHDDKGIVAWLKKKTESPLEVLTTSDQLKDLRNNFAVVITGFFKDAESEAAKHFAKVADKIDDLHFAITNSPSIFSQYNVNKDTVVMFRTFDEERVDLDGEINADTLEEFVDLNRLPLVVDFDPNWAPAVMDSRVRKHVLYFISKEDERFTERIKTLRETAKKFKGHAIFVHVDIDDKNYGRILNWFFIKKEDCPETRLVNLEGSTKYRPDTEDWTAEELGQFVQDVMDGKRRELYASEDIPEDWDSKPVKVLVGKNFDRVALEPTKAVFVKFYAPWCGFCKDLAPTWEALGEEYKDSKDVIIAELDATANEIQGHRIKIFPTMKFFPKGNTEAIEFQNINTTLERLIKFVENGGKLPEEIKVDPEGKDKSENDQHNIKKEEL